jgi:membrane protease YdiL (CAAX protease family)
VESSRPQTTRRGIDLHEIAVAPAGEEAEERLPMAPLGPLQLPPARGWGWKVVQWPLCRVGLAVAAVWIGWAVAATLLHALPRAQPGQTISMQLGRAATVLILVHAAYVLYVRLVEWRRAGEVSLIGAAREAAAGAAIGGSLMAAAVGILWLAGYYHVHGLRSPAVLVPAATLSLLAGYTEELGLRVICFRILEEWLGTGWALALSAAVFGFLHMTNPHATPISIASIALAGVLLGAAFAVTRRIWLPAGLHFAWNFVQGGIFGVPVSGVPLAGLLMGSLGGPAALSGGVFGVEGSLLSVALCAAAAVPLLRVAARRHHLAPPRWKPAPLPTARPPASGDNEPE